MYENGRGVTQDDKTAVKWYTLAARQGNADAQFKLCLSYDCYDHRADLQLNSPNRLVAIAAEDLLRTWYRIYIFIAECSKLSYQYISNEQYSIAKTKIKGIQEYIKSNNRELDTDVVWESAVDYFDKTHGRTFEVHSVAGTYDDELNKLCRKNLLDLNDVKVPGVKKKKRKKDF